MRQAKLRKVLWNFALVAQWIEQEPSNLLAVGSIPTEGTNKSAVSGLSLIASVLLSPVVSFPGIPIDVLET